MKKPAKTRSIKAVASDMQSWNFVIFLTLSLILLVTVLSVLSRTAKDIRIKARLDCPDVSQNLPRPEDCPGGKWTYSRDASGCPVFVCE